VRECCASIFLLDEDGLHLAMWRRRQTSRKRYARQRSMNVHRVLMSDHAAQPPYLRQPVFVSDILSHPNWGQLQKRRSAEWAAARAAWSTPIMSQDGKVLGTFLYVLPRS